MIERPAPALVDALALLRAPRGPRLRAGERLPEGVFQLIRIVAGEEEALASAAATSGEHPGTVREAAAFYIQQVLFAPGSDSFRVLGVNPDAEDERVREHYRWLARWLHPDRNPDSWEVVFAERVGQAWQDLRTPERRSRYEQSGGEAESRPPETFRAAPIVPRRVVDTDAGARRVDLRWLPKAIFGALGISALAGLGLIFAVRMSDERRATERSMAIEDQPAATVREVSPAFAQPPAASPVLAATPAPIHSETPVLAPPAETEPTAPLQGGDEVVDDPAASMPEPSEARTASKPVLAHAPPPVTAPPVPTRTATSRVSARAAESVQAPPEVSVSRSAEVVAVSDPGPAVAARPAPAPAEPRVSPTAKMGTRDANRLLSHFSRAYENGDLRGMRAMFANDARGPRGGVEVILSDYERVFANSRERSLDVRDVSWFVSGDTLTIIASFEATVTGGKSGRPRKTRGDLRLDLRRRNDQWQIYRLQHDERPG